MQSTLRDVLRNCLIMRRSLDLDDFTVKSGSRFVNDLKDLAMKASAGKINSQCEIFPKKQASCVAALLETRERLSRPNLTAQRTLYV